MNSASITDDFVKQLDSYLQSTLSEHRYQHSLSTAQTCRKLAERFGQDSSLAFFIGLVHDVAREYPDPDLIAWAAKDNKPVGPLYMASPMLLHGRAGAEVLREKFGIEDPVVLDAIRAHTTGDAGMSVQAKILFVADYIEPKRKHLTPEFLKSIEGLDLDGMVYGVLMGTLNHLADKGKAVAPEALALKKELEIER